MSAGVILIGPFELFLATGFIVAAAIMSLAFSLGLVRSLLIATVRTYIQLLALGMVLRWVFQVETPLIVLALVLLMIVLSVHVLLGRVTSAPKGIWLPAFWSMFLSGITVTFAVTAIIIQVDPWYKAQYVIPIAGMILGNSMTGISLALERLFSDLKQRRDEIWMLLSLGALPWEAAIPTIRRALTAGLIPTINSMSAVGIVSIPGMMTGQILAGMDPGIAAKYQIVVMLMLSASTAIGAMLAVLLSYGRVFDGEGRYIGTES